MRTAHEVLGPQFACMRHAGPPGTGHEHATFDFKDAYGVQRSEGVHGWMRWWADPS